MLFTPNSKYKLRVVRPFLFSALNFHFSILGSAGFLNMVTYVHLCAREGKTKREKSRQKDN